MNFTKRVIAVALCIVSLMSVNSVEVFAASTTTTSVNTVGKKIVTPREALPVTSEEDVLSVDINTKKGTRNYVIFSQKGKQFGPKSYINVHGCAACSLTTVLTGFVPKYKNYTPNDTYKKLEKRVFGSAVWNRNYRKSPSSQMPVSLYGITKILKNVGVKCKYITRFKDASAVRTIKKHLYTGNPVVIEVNNHMQKNGRFSSKYTHKWALSKHTMVLLGMTENGKVIVADSAYRAWSGQKQRIKYAKMEELVKYMIPCTKTSKSCYYTSVASSGGFILVNP